eukprot:gene2367-3355_t
MDSDRAGNVVVDEFRLQAAAANNPPDRLAPVCSSRAARQGCRYGR